MTSLIVGVKAAAQFSFMPANTVLRCHSNNADWPQVQCVVLS
jgi:hypothetical protein